MSCLPSSQSSRDSCFDKAHLIVAEVATIIVKRRALQLEGGEILAVPPPAQAALPQALVEQWIESALSEVRRAGLRGQSVTPFLLTRLRELSGGRTLTTNIALIEHNAATAAALAGEISRA